jgi:hypothetical protein
LKSVEQIRLLARPLLLIACCPIAVAGEVFVDQMLDRDCENYLPETRSCGAGADRAYAVLDDGLASLRPGDVLYLREGTYGALNVPVSGAPGSPIEIRGMTGESVTVSAPAVALRLIDQAHIVVADMAVTVVEGFGRLENATGISIENVHFSRAAASGTTGALKLVRSSLNKIVNSSFDSGSDLIVLQDDSDRNLVLGNEFGRASHSLISIRCSSGNIIRGNSFKNPDQKAMEIYDCEGVSDAPVRFDDTHRNVVEWNRFLGTAPSGRAHDFNAIQHGGQGAIVRFNVFTGNRGGGVNYQYYRDESRFVSRNRLYNNTFVKNSCHGIIGQEGDPRTFYDNRIVNNLLYGNVDCRGARNQTTIWDDRLVVWLKNSERDSEPAFVDAMSGDFRLRPESGEIDEGVFIAKAVSDGDGTKLPVDDVNWFHDGFGIPGERGDRVQIEGQSEAIEIADIDYESSTLVLVTPAKWRRDDGIHLAYSGRAPDMGAYEYGLEPSYRMR